MAIHELEPRIRIGPLEVGKRVGKEIKPENIVQITERFDDSKFRRLLHAIRIWRRPTVEQGLDVLVISSNSLMVYRWMDNYEKQFGVVGRGRNLTAQAINLHPIVGKRLRWLP